jgi:hypothetical protein
VKVVDRRRRRFRPRDFGRYKCRGLARKGAGPAAPDGEPVGREVEKRRWYGGRGTAVCVFGANREIRVGV